MRAYYRLSDKSHPKLKLPGATKGVCLANFLDVFHPSIASTTVLADNCEPQTIDWLKAFQKERQYRLISTNLGNAGSLLECLKLATKEETNPDSPIYFVEDDYLHMPDSKAVIVEGMGIYDYVTLYDHPDKYTSQYAHGEECKVRRENLSHWRNTISTCMTFATSKSALEQDMAVWEGFLRDANVPQDHFIFEALHKTRPNYRPLGVCIPGRACHTDMTYSGTQGQVMMEPWAIKMMIDLHQKSLDAACKRGLPVKAAKESLLGTGPVQCTFDTLTKMAAIVDGLKLMGA